MTTSRNVHNEFVELLGNFQSHLKVLDTAAVGKRDQEYWLPRRYRLASAGVWISGFKSDIETKPLGEAAFLTLPITRTAVASVTQQTDVQFLNSPDAIYMAIDSVLQQIYNMGLAGNSDYPPPPKVHASSTGAHFIQSPPFENI